MAIFLLVVATIADLALAALLVGVSAGFIFSRRGKTGVGLAVAWLPPAGALVATMIPAPY